MGTRQSTLENLEVLKLVNVLSIDKTFARSKKVLSMIKTNWPHSCGGGEEA